MMNIKSFARQYRLRIRRDECGDPIIPGRRGQSQLYFAGSDGLCLMVLDGPRVKRSRWHALGGKLWLGDISAGVQDVKITNIPMENARLAIRLARVKPVRVVSEAQREVLRRARMLIAR